MSCMFTSNKPFKQSQSHSVLTQYHWRELPQVSFFLSQEKYACRDKTFVATNIFVTTNTCLYYTCGSSSQWYSNTRKRNTANCTLSVFTSHMVLATLNHRVEPILSAWCIYWCWNQNFGFLDWLMLFRVGKLGCSFLCIPCMVLVTNRRVEPVLLPLIVDDDEVMLNVLRCRLTY